MLLVRKRGTQAFMQPGGKIDDGETAEQALKKPGDQKVVESLLDAIADYFGVIRPASFTADDIESSLSAQGRPPPAQGVHRQRVCAEVMVAGDYRRYTQSRKPTG